MYINPFIMYAIRREICNIVDPVQVEQLPADRGAPGTHTDLDQHHHCALRARGFDYPAGVTSELDGNALIHSFKLLRTTTI